MSTQQTPTSDRPVDPTAGDDGGFAARRAIVRWAWRLFRREWRQQALVLGLLTVAVAAMAFVAAAAYAGSESPEHEFGTADLMFRLDGADPSIGSKITAIEDVFGTTEVITTSPVTAAGLVEQIEFRVQAPEGDFTAPLLDLRQGRYPSGGNEIAVTDGVAGILDAAVGDRVAVGGDQWTVVGIVENPNDLNKDFALVASASTLCAPQSSSTCSVQIFVGGDATQLASLRSAIGDVEHEWRPASQRALAAVAVFGLASIVLLLVALVAAAGFVVMAQRRQRQLGMLAALGATDKHLRLVVTANGAVIGALAAVIGTTIALPSWYMAAPRLEGVAGRRIDPFDVPWWLIATGLALAVVTATAAAWWPARLVARMSITDALAARPPRPESVRRSTAWAAAVTAAGAACLVLADRSNPLLVAVGTLATVIGVLMATPVVLRVAGWAAAWLPVAVRLSVRNLARYQLRSSAALAAITLVMGIPVATVVIASAAEHTLDEGNLSDRQLLVHIEDWDGANVPVRSATELAELDAQVDRMAETWRGATVVPLDMAINPTVDPVPSRDFSEEYRSAVTLGDGAIVYVATRELLAYHGIDPDGVAADVLTTQTGEIRLESFDQVNGEDVFADEILTTVDRIDAPSYTSTPTALITGDGLRQRGWEPMRARWLIDTSQPITSDQVAAASSLADDAGLSIERRDPQTQLTPIRTGATTIGILLALSILAMTIGLIRGETAGDLRTLTAAGATSSIRRTLTASTAGTLAALGALLGTLSAYLALIAGYVGDTSNLTPVPLTHLAVIVLGAPAAAITAGWMISGRQPPSLTRPANE